MSDAQAMYARFVKLAYNKIKNYGKPIVLHQMGSSDDWTKTINPVNGTTLWVNKKTGDRLTVDPTKNATLFKGYGLQDRYKGITANNANIQLTDIRLYAVGIPQPRTGDLITLNRKTHTVVMANPVQPGDPVILWDIQLR